VEVSGAFCFGGFGTAAFSAPNAAAPPKVILGALDSNSDFMADLVDDTWNRFDLSVSAIIN
jgi:hypothetical protein